MTELPFEPDAPLGDYGRGWTGPTTSYYLEVTGSGYFSVDIF